MLRLPPVFEIHPRLVTVVAFLSNAVGNGKIQGASKDTDGLWRKAFASLTAFREGSL